MANYGFLPPTRYRIKTGIDIMNCESFYSFNTSSSRGVLSFERVLGALFSILFFLAISGTVVRQI
jgi:hypothetical protein